MLSKRSVEVLLDLAENKLSDIVPFDREDMREIKSLQACVNELRALVGRPPLEGSTSKAERIPVRMTARPASA